jgi:type II secretory pathway pseudopilin PulG
MQHGQQQRGFTYLGVLLAVALIGIGLAAASEVWVTIAKRQRLEQLEWVGEQYVSAIGSYYESSPGRVKVFPRTLQDLLEDKRYLTVRRHLRQLYVDPLTGAVDWELVLAPDGGIRGVRTPSHEADEPVTTAGREFSYVIGGQSVAPATPVSPR